MILVSTILPAIAGTKDGKIFILLYTSILFCEISFSQQWQTFTEENSGLADNRTRSIVIDKNGVKWIGTMNGLNKYDGVAWSTFTTDDSLSDNQVLDVSIEDTNSSELLWIGTEDGISFATLPLVFFEGPLRTDNSDLTSDRVSAVAVDHTSVKWFGTDSGLSAYGGEQWRTITTADMLSNNHVLSIGINRDGWKYIGTKGGGVTRLFSESIDAVTSASPLESTWSGLLSDSVYAVFVDSSGVQWFGTDAGVSSHAGENSRENWDIYTTDSGLANNFVHAISQDLDGNMWFGTREGVSSFDGVAWGIYTTADGLCHNNVYDIAVDSDNSVWFATDSGLSCYSSNPTSLNPKIKPEDLSIFTVRTFPNPFNSVITLEVSLAAERIMSIKVFDILGRQVRSIGQSRLRNGRSLFRWDGTDGNGVQVPSGIYLVHITNGQKSAVNKIVLIK